MAEFIYRPPENDGQPKVINCTVGVKFSQNVRFLDPWGTALILKSPWQRILFRLRHPIAYSKRYLWRLYYFRIRPIFIKDKLRPL
jgi:hypothetical protein